MAVTGCPKGSGIEPETIVQPYGAPPRPDDGGPPTPALTDAGAPETQTVHNPAPIYGGAPPKP